MFIWRRYNQNLVENLETSDEESNKKDIKILQLSRQMKIIVIILTAIALASINSLELVYFNFGTTFFQYIAIKMKASVAAHVSSAMAITYTVSQAFNLFVAMFVSTKYMIVYHYIVTFAAIIGLIFVQHSELWVWILAVAVGYGFSLLYPG